MKSKNIVLLVMTLICIRCNVKNECKEDPYVNEYSKGNFDQAVPPVNWDLNIILKIENNKVVAIKNFTLYKIYKSNFTKEFSSFKDFFCSLFSGKVVLNESNFIENSKFFDLDETIRKEYESENINGIISKYCNVLAKDDLRIKKEFKAGQLYSILYYLFISKYFIRYSDYSGDFHISKK
jgi:hypothetical protein